MRYLAAMRSAEDRSQDPPHLAEDPHLAEEAADPAGRTDPACPEDPGWTVDGLAEADLVGQGLGCHRATAGSSSLVSGSGLADLGSAQTEARHEMRPG